MSRTIIVAVFSLVLAGSIARAVECQTAGRDFLAYYNGELVTVDLKPMPENATSTLTTHHEALGTFFSGAPWACSVTGNVGVCFLSEVTPVIESNDGPPIYQAVEIFYPGSSPQPHFTHYSEIEAAAASGGIHVFPRPTLYRISVRGSTGDGVAVSLEKATELPPRAHGVSIGSAQAHTEVSWGSVKAIFY